MSHRRIVVAAGAFTGISGEQSHCIVDIDCAVTACVQQVVIHTVDCINIFLIGFL